MNTGNRILGNNVFA